MNERPKDEDQNRPMDAETQDSPARSLKSKKLNRDTARRRAADNPTRDGYETR